MLQTGDDFYQMTAAYLTRAASENVRHAEVFISPQAHLRRGIADPNRHRKYPCRLRRRASAHHGMTGGVIAGIQRQFDEADALDMITALKPWRDRILGLGHRRAGDRPSAIEISPSIRGWRAATMAGARWPTPARKAAPSTCGKPSICSKSTASTTACAARPIPIWSTGSLTERTPLTVCPCSNIMLRVFPNMTSHNIRKLHEAGLCITVNSDDPPYFGGYINRITPPSRPRSASRTKSCGRWRATASPAPSCRMNCAAVIWPS